ncbi:MAG TPA: undecaprenyl-phosphate glucose phosphotransferase, partial [Ignavibacteriaceae bacterium]
AFLLSAIIAQSLTILIERNYMFILLAVLNFLWYFVSNVVSFYDDIRTRYYTFQLVNIFKILIFQATASILFIFFVKEDLFTRNFILLYSFLLFLFVSTRVIVVRSLLSSVRGRKRNSWNLLIIGAGDIGKGFYEMLEKHKEFGYNFLGFVDDQVSDSENIIGKISSLDNIITEKKVDEIIIALPIYASDQLDEIIHICNKHAVRVNIIPDYFRFVSKKFQVNMMGDFPIIQVRNEPLAETHWRFIKRIFDITFSFITIILVLSWLLPVLFLLNKIFSKGPVLFTQDRIGTNNKIFKCYKLRTMHVNRGEDSYRPLVENDPRITGIGRFLRRSNLDEVPQFFNVLKGEMSIVGPRPHALPYNRVYENMIEEIKIRSWVKPGLTGWAQVPGSRGDVEDFELNKVRTIKRIEYDLWYIENWTFWLDIQIILLTVWRMIKGESQGV